MARKKRDNDFLLVVVLSHVDISLRRVCTITLLTCAGLDGKIAYNETRKAWLVDLDVIVCVFKIYLGQCDVLGYCDI